MICEVVGKSFVMMNNYFFSGFIILSLISFIYEMINPHVYTFHAEVMITVE